MCEKHIFLASSADRSLEPKYITPILIGKTWRSSYLKGNLLNQIKRYSFSNYLRRQCRIQNFSAAFEPWDLCFLEKNLILIQQKRLKNYFEN